jgi:hypothetical protein
LFSNGPLQGNSGWCNQGPSQCGLTPPGRFSVFDDFQLSNRFLVTGFDYNDFFHYGDPAAYVNTVWSIWSGNPSQRSATMLYSGTSVATLAPSTLGSYLFTVNGLAMELDNGAYWLGISNTVLSGSITTYGSAGGPGSGVFTTDGSSYYSMYHERVFSVYGSEVPVPASAWLFLSGLSGLMAKKLRKQLRHRDR